MKTSQVRAAGGGCAFCGRSASAARAAGLRGGAACAGFTLIELLVVIAIIGLLVGLTLPGLFNARRLSMQTQNTANLKQFGTAAGTYGADYQERIWSFSWRADTPVTSQVPLKIQQRGFNNDVEAAKWQAISIIRRRGDQPAFPDQGPWIPHVLYAHLVLQDYLQARIPEPMVRSPFDRVRAQWTRDISEHLSPAQIATKHGLPGEPATTGQRWPFSSSYQQTPACYTPDRQIGAGFLRQGETEGVYQIPDSVIPQYRFGDRRFHEVTFPSQKVLVMESVGRHYGKTPLFYTHHDARTTNAIFDGSVRVLHRPSVNPGGYLVYAGLNTASIRADVTYEPVPAIGLDPWPDSSTSIGLDGYQRWTLGGLRGVDFGGSEAFPPASRDDPKP